MFISRLLAARIEQEVLPTGLGGPLGGEGLGPFGPVSWTKDILGSKFGDAISAIVGFMTVVAGLFFLFQFLIGTIQWIASGGDKAGLQQAQQKITNSLVGLVLVVAAVAIVSLIGTFLGFEILNPARFIEAIRFR